MRIVRIGFIVLFMFMLFVPLVSVDLTPDRISVQENRMLAGRPPSSDIKNHPVAFIRQFDAWYKDSTGFREQVLALYNIIGKNKWLNGVQYTGGQYTYLIGEQGHHYFAHENGRMIPNFQGKKLLSDKQLQNMALNLEYIKTYLDNKGIPLVVMFCTDKESIYPEFYPKSIKRGPEPIQLDVITRYLQNHTSTDVFNIRQALLAEKNNHLLYPVSSGDLTHYTQIAAFFAYQELINHINVYFPQIVQYTLNDVEISYDEIGIPNVTLMKEKTYQRAHTNYFDLYDGTRDFNFMFENTDPDLPVILLFSDSYAKGEFFIKYVAQHFGKTIMTHWLNMEHFEDFVSKFDPDIIVLESAEREIVPFANCIIELSELP
jgi:hypothetical protein